MTDGPGYPSFLIGILEQSIRIEFESVNHDLDIFNVLLPTKMNNRTRN